MKIVVDSSFDLNNKILNMLNLRRVPLTITVNGKTYNTDENLETTKLLAEMKEDENIPKTACPSPQSFLEAYEEDEDIFVVTLSSKLSGTYNSAVMAKDIVLEKYKDKFIHVFDSKSASVGETLVGLKIFELAKENIENMDIVEKVTQYVKEMKTFFVLESLENLIKAGRINKLKGKIASVMSIKPIMGGTDEGSIDLVKKVRGSKRALRKLVDIIGEQGERLEEKVLGIAHCNALDRAEKFKEEVLARYNFKDVIIVETSSISTVYANEGGIVIAF
ncbi:DegV family protein [Clostridiisalibacter paucivorans]|uniref:DegV family protein n=1 Tax=Clostridiisalibacter paucivorans TaxID=408753 RepID=UPI00047EE301|nr:DegV family protein [Clostridiisalibacter paucivorans]